MQTVLPEALFRRMLRNDDLYGVANHLQLIEAELSEVRSQKKAWREVMEDDLVAVLERDHSKLKNRAGRLVLAEMTRQEAWLSDLFMQADVIRYEAANADYIRLRDFDPAELQALRDEVDTTYAVDPRQVYWPFNGEYWEDELGYYTVVSPGRCE